MCLRPIDISYFDPVTHERKCVLAPCGKCVECVLRYQQDWELRMAEESKEWQYCYFLTLTYNDAHLPLTTLNLRRCDAQSFYDINRKLTEIPVTKDLVRARSKYEYLRVWNPLLTKVPTVSKRDIQLYMKRVRKSLSSYPEDLRTFKYFLCSEYGPKTLRPHYHVIFFTNLDVYDFTKHFVTRWEEEFGNVHWKKEPLTGTKGINGDIKNAFAYCSKYAAKPSFLDNPYYLHPDFPRCFRLISKGIGRKWRDDLTKKIDIKSIINYADYQRKHFSLKPKNIVLPDWVKSFYHGQHYILSDDFFKTLNNYLYVNVFDSKKDRFFKLPIPRYVRESALYPRRIRTVDEYLSPYDFWKRTLDPSRKETRKAKYVKVYDHSCFFANTLNILQSRFRGEIYSLELEILRAQNPTRSDSEIIHLYTLQTEEALKKRYELGHALFLKYYNKCYSQPYTY